MLEAPDVMTYSRILSHETVQVSLTMAALKDLEVKSSNIINAYLKFPLK